MLNSLVLIFFLVLSFNANAKMSIQKVKSLTNRELNFVHVNKFGRHALSQAILNKNYDVANYLATRGIGNNLKDYLGKTPLMLALKTKAPVDVVVNLLNGGASTKFKDKEGRGVQYYTRSVGAEIKKIVEDHDSRYENLSLKSDKILKIHIRSFNTSELDAFFKKYGVLNFSKGKAIFEFLLQNKTLEKISLSFFLEYGLDLNNEKALYYAIKTKEYSIAEYILDFKVSLRSISKKVSAPIVLANKMCGPDILLRKLYQNSHTFNYKDNSGNTALHYAATCKNQAMFDLYSNKISINSLNNKGQSPLSLLVQKSDTKKIEELLANDNVDFNAKDSTGNDLAFVIVKRRPDLFYKLMPIMLKSGYDFKTVGLSSRNARQEYSETEFAKKNKITSDNVDTDLLVDIVDVEDKQYSEDTEDYSAETKTSQSIEQTFLGDYNLEKIINNSVDRYLSKLLSGISKKLNSHDSKKGELGIKISEISNYILIKKGELSQKKSEYNNNRTIYEKERSYFENTRIEYLEFKSNVKRISNGFKSKVFSIQSDLSFYKNAKRELEEIISNLKASREGESAELQIAKASLLNEKKMHKFKTNEINQLFRIQANDLNTDLRGIESDLNESRRLLSDANNRYNQINTKIKRDKKSLKRNRFLMNTPEHQKVHNRATCSYYKNIVNYNKSIERLEKQKEVAKSNVREYEKRVKRYKKELDYKRNEIRIKKNELKTERDTALAEENSRHEESHLEIKENISDLEIALEYRFVDLKNEIDELNDSMIMKYGDLESFENDWNNVSKVTNLLMGGLENFEEVFQCSSMPGVGYISCQPSTKFVFSSMLGEELNSELSSLSSQYLGYLKKKRSLKFRRVTSGSLQNLHYEISDLEEYIALQKEKLSELKRESKSVDESNQSLLQQKLGTYKLVKLYEFTGEKNFSGEPKDISAETLKYFLSKGIDIDSFFKEEARKNSVSASKKFISLNDIDFSSIIYSEELKPAEEVRFLAYWHDIISKESLYSGAIFNKTSKDIFVNALSSNLKFEKVGTKDKHTVKIITTIGEFIIGKDGQIVPHEQESVFDFDLVSTGEFRRRLENVLASFKEQAKGKFTEAELENSLDIQLVRKMVRIADDLYTSSIGSDALKFLEIAAKTGLAASGYGPTVIALAGLPSCSYEIYRKIKQGYKGTATEKFFTFLGCWSSVVTKKFKIFDGVYSLTNILNKMLNKLKLGNSNGAKGIKNFILSLGGFSDEKIVKKLFEIFSEKKAVFEEINGTFNKLSLLDVDVRKVKLGVHGQEVSFSKYLCNERLDVYLNSHNDRILALASSLNDHLIDLFKLKKESFFTLEPSLACEKGDTIFVSNLGVVYVKSN